MKSPDEKAEPGWADLTKKWQEMMMGSWSTATKEVVASDAFAAATSATLDASLAWQKQIRQQSGQYMDALELPKRSDLARLSKQVSGLQARLLDVEDKLDATLEILKALSVSATAEPPATPAPARPPSPKAAPRKESPKPARGGKASEKKRGTKRKQS